jgi:DNA-binding winged helix-turn-helix (wHTH) protein/tetratricopeptide (TPR) repeat protein
MNDSAPPAYEFGAFRVDAANHRLLRDGEPVPLKPKAFDTLLVLVENAGRVMAKDELLRRLWPDTIVEEANVSQNVYELRKALGDDARPHRYVENVPRRGYRFVGEVTRHGSAAEKKAVLAVLPFRPLAGRGGSEHLELGIADSIIAALTSVRRLAVRSTSAASRHTGPGRDALAAARELNAGFVVDGTVQTANDGVRVTVQLLEVASRSAVWAGRFDGTMAEIFALQDAIAVKVAAAVGLELGGRDDALLRRHPTEDPEAYQLYLKGRYHWAKATPEGLWKSIDFFRAAIRADPRYALAYVGIADAYASLDWYGVLSAREARPRAMEAAERALEIDDSLAEAHASLAVARQNAWDWAGAEHEYRIAIALHPDHAPARQWYGVFLAFMGRFDEALAEIRRAETLDPVSLSIASQVALVLLCARRYAEAQAQARRTLELDADSVEARFYLAMAYQLQGRPREAIPIYRGLPAENPDFRAMLAHACGTAGDGEQARAIIAGLVAESESSYVAPFWLAVAQLGTGDVEQALASLERACDDPDDSLLAIKVFPMLDPIRSEPRFQRVLARMKLS